MYKVKISDENAAIEYGMRLAKTLPAGAVVALIGDLGAGKTTLTKGIAAGLGIEPEQVTSPTFAIIQEYSGGRLPLYHFDVYRISGSEDELLELGYEEYFYGDGVTVVEWADMMRPLLPQNAIVINMVQTPDSSGRIYEISGDLYDDNN